MALPLALYNLRRAKKQSKTLDKLISNRPEYKINDEAYDNQAIARARAYGRDRSIQQQEENLEQDAANAMSRATDITSSTSGLLNAIASINASNSNARRGLAQDEATIQAQNMNQLIGVNNQMIDEKDKAWNFNKNMPYQLRVAALRDKIKYNQEQAAQQFAASSNFMTNMFAGGGFNWQNNSQAPSQPQSQQMSVNWRPEYGAGSYGNTGLG